MKEWGLKVALSLLAVFAPAKGMIVTAFVLIVVDLITGVLAARKEKQPITSAGIGRTVVKALVYETAIILAFLTQTYLTGPEIPCANIVASLIGLTELKSILENLQILSGGQLLNMIIDKLGSKNQTRD